MPETRSWMFFCFQPVTIADVVEVFGFASASWSGGLHSEAPGAVGGRIPGDLGGGGRGTGERRRSSVQRVCQEKKDTPKNSGFPLVPKMGSPKKTRPKASKLFFSQQNKVTIEYDFGAAHRVPLKKRSTPSGEYARLLGTAQVGRHPRKRVERLV